MTQKPKETERLSIDVDTQEHRSIKALAASKGLSIRMFVLQCVRENLAKDKDATALLSVTSQISPALKELWDNERDSAYDEL